MDGILERWDPHYLLHCVSQVSFLYELVGGDAQLAFQALRKRSDSLWTHPNRLVSDGVPLGCRVDRPSKLDYFNLVALMRILERKHDHTLHHRGCQSGAWVMGVHHFPHQPLSDPTYHQESHTNTQAPVVALTLSLLYTQSVE